MKEKTQTARGDGECDPKNKVVIRVCGEEHPAKRARQRHAARNAVDAVHEVVGVGETDDPQDGDDETHRAELQLPEERNGDRFEISHAQHGRKRDQSLHGKTHARTERMNVVTPAEVGNDRAADEVDQAMNPIGIKCRPSPRREDDDDDRQPPTARSWRGMGTALVGMVNDAAALGVLTNDPHADGGEDGEECEDEDGSHRGDSKRVFGSCLIWELILFRRAMGLQEAEKSKEKELPSIYLLPI